MNETFKNSENDYYTLTLLYSLPNYLNYRDKLLLFLEPAFSYSILTLH